MKIGILVLVLGVGCVAAPAQDIVENALGAGRAATTSAPAAGAGKGVAGAFKGLNKVLQTGQEPAAPGSSTPVSPTRKAENKADVKEKMPVVIYEDPKGIQKGMGYVELVKRFGPPSMEVSTEAGKKTLSYAGKEGATSVEIQDNTVISVQTAQPQQSAVVIL